MLSLLHKPCNNKVASPSSAASEMVKANQFPTGGGAVVSALKLKKSFINLPWKVIATAKTILMTLTQNCQVNTIINIYLKKKKIKDTLITALLKYFVKSIIYSVRNEILSSTEQVKPHRKDAN